MKYLIVHDHLVPERRIQEIKKYKHQVDVVLDDNHTLALRSKDTDALFNYLIQAMSDPKILFINLNELNKQVNDEVRGRSS